MEPKPEFLDENGEIDWSGAPHNGYTLDEHGNPIRHEHVPQAGDRFDRYGDPNGRYVSPIPEEGSFPYETRSLPYAENPNAYHEYEWTRSPADIHDVYDELDGPTRNALDAMLTKYGLDLSDLDHVLRGEAAAAFDQPGGATQDMLPTTVEMLRKLGLIREV